MACIVNGVSQNIVPLESNGAVPVNVQDQTTPLFDFYFQQALSQTTLQAATVRYQYTIDVSSAAGFVVGSYLGVFGQGRYFFAEVLSILGTVLTLDTPLDFDFANGSTVVRLTRDLNVNGAVTPQVFGIFGPAGGNIKYDITRFMLSIETATAPQLPEFGDLSALTHGLVLRRNDSQTRNYWNIKSNLEFGLHAYDIQLLSAVGPGADGILMRYTFAGADKHGVTVRLGAGDTLELLIQDDLTGLSKFRALAEGHEVTD